MTRRPGAILPVAVTAFGIVAFLVMVAWAVTPRQRWPWSTNVPAATVNTDQSVVACQDDARICPDGSVVGRSGPSCAFPECPAEAASPTSTDTNTNAANASTRSYGLWFPFNAGLTINNPRPVIYGKVSQVPRDYLTTTFTDLDWVGRDFSGAKKLTYVTGPVTGLTVELDGVPIGGLQGFAQFPSIACYQYVDTGDGLETELFDTAAACRRHFRDRLPPLIFVFRPTADLSAGTHTLEVGGETMTFTFEPTATLPAQTRLPTAQGKYAYEYLDTIDNCSPGYYQSKNDFPLALPSLDNPQLFYGLSFPQSEKEKGSINRRHVELSLGGQRYPVFFPDAPTYFEGKLIGQSRGREDFGLFLPIDHLVYGDGKPATLWGLFEADPRWPSPTGYYSELYTIDTIGRTYRSHALPWVMSTSSGCDG